MRVRQIVVTVVLLGAVGALSDCSGSAGSDGLPKGLVGSTTSPSASPTGSPVASPTTPPPTTSPAARPAATTSPVPLVLADTGIDGLHLGQSKKQALATRLIGKIIGPYTDDSVGCAMYHGKRGIDVVYFHRGKVVVISVTRSIRTNKGIRIGDTYLARRPRPDRPFPEQAPTDCIPSMRPRPAGPSVPDSSG